MDKDVPQEIRVGEAFTETLTVKNVSKEDLHGVVVRETFSPNFEPTDGEAQVSPGEARWNVGTLRAGESRTLRLTGRAKAEGDLVQCTQASYETQLCTVRVAVVPKLELSLSGPQEALSCEPIVYKGVLRNTGSARLPDVRLNEQIPEGLVPEEGQKGTSGMDVGTLAPGESKPFEMRLKASRPGSYTGKATASSQGITVESPWSTIVREPALSIKAAESQDRYLGTTAPAEVTVTNTGDAPSPDTVVEWTLPAGASFVTADHGGEGSGQAANWNLGTLAPGESRRVSASYTSEKVGVASGQIKASGRCAKPVTADVRTEFRGVPAVLLEVTDDLDPVRLGDPVTYTIEVTNQGSALLTNLRVTCDLEEGMEFVNAPEAQQNGRTVSSEPVESLEVGHKAVWKVTVKATKLADARFKVRLTGDQLERPVEESESTHFISR